MITPTLVLVLAALIAPAPGSPTPACVQSAVKAEVRAPDALRPAPTTVPARGPAGTPVTITATGMPERTMITFVALSAADRCAFPYAVFLGQAPATAEGTATLIAPWPEGHEPLYGDEPRVRLPRGDYWIVALPCAARGSCSVSEGSLAGGPFTLADAAGSSMAPAMVLAAVGTAGALAALARRRR